MSLFWRSIIERFHCTHVHVHYVVHKRENDIIHPFSILLVPRVWFERESYTATEGAATENRLMVTVVSDRPVPRGVVKVDIVDGTAKG